MSSTEVEKIFRDEAGHALATLIRLVGDFDAYAVRGAIPALHARAPSYRSTDWKQIAGLYEVLLRICPSPVIELNHAAVLSMVDGPAQT